MKEYFGIPIAECGIENAMHYDFEKEE